MDIGKIFIDILASVLYVIIWVAAWGVTETIIEKYTPNNLDKRMVIYAVVLLLSVLSYIFVIKKELHLQYISIKDDKPKVSNLV
jgi:hypothetical protein